MHTNTATWHTAHELKFALTCITTALKQLREKSKHGNKDSDMV